MEIISLPFPHCIIDDFLPEEKAQELLQALGSQQFFLKESDLFTFYQTNDLTHSKNEKIQLFIQHILSDEFITQLETKTKQKLSKSKIDLFGSLYQNTHYLLPHDDQLEGRAIAFIYYLSNQSKSDGGALALFDSSNNQPTKITARIQPQFNRFAFFVVSKKSFHQVEEVLKDTDRIALSGWFHYDK